MEPATAFSFHYSIFFALNFSTVKWNENLFGWGWSLMQLEISPPIHNLDINVCLDIHVLVTSFCKGYVILLQVLSIFPISDNCIMLYFLDIFL